MLRAQLIPPAVVALATIAAFGPHLAMLGYHVAGVTPPAELVLFCPLHHLEGAHAAHPAPTWTIGAKPLA